jgi:hypothetical protein
MRFQAVPANVRHPRNYSRFPACRGRACASLSADRRDKGRLDVARVRAHVGKTGYPA